MSARFKIKFYLYIELIQLRIIKMSKLNSIKLCKLQIANSYKKIQLVYAEDKIEKYCDLY